MKKYIIHKKETTASTDLSDDYTSETNLTDTNDYTETDTDQYGGELQFKSISTSNYKKPASGSRQDNLSKEEIKERLKGYIPLRSMQEKKILTKLPYFKTWVRYINENTKQFRTGGLLMKVVYPDYIMLANTNQSLTWSVQLKNNMIFIKNPQELQEQQEKKKKDEQIKDKLYEMYKKGQLKTIKK